MSGVVVFDSAAFVAQYPAFAAYNTAHSTGLQGYFDTATLFLNNTASSFVQVVARRSQLLNMLVAHLATLDGVLTAAGQGSQAGRVGRLASASEGSVSTSFDNGSQSAGAAFYQQTQYGSTYWNATAPYRTFRAVGRRC